MKLVQPELVASWDEAEQRTVQAWQDSGDRLLRVEGFMAVGKSTLSHRVQKLTHASLLGTDTFATGAGLGRKRPYIEALDIPALRSRATEIRKRSELIIFEGVCLEFFRQRTFALGFAST